MEYIPAKSIVSGYAENNQWFGVNYNMNIYRGCSHGCIYCDSRSEVYGIERFDEVRAKENALDLIASELRAKRKKGVVGTGAMSDPYNPYEKKHNLTRGALTLLDRYGFGAAIATKSDLVTRDIDILKRIAVHSPALIKMTVTAADDALCHKIEPNAAPSSERFGAIARLSEAGIFSGILMMPVLPFIEDTEENITGIIKLAHESGAKFIYPAFGVTLRQNQRQWFYKMLDTRFPAAREKYIKRFGNDYACHSPNADALWTVFRKKCDSLGMPYEMRDIISGYKQGYDDPQISMF